MVAEPQSLYRLLVDNSTDALSIVDAQGVVTYVNAAGEHVFGRAPEDLVGESAFRYVHPDDRPAVLATFQRCIADHVAGHGEYRYQIADGGWRVLESFGQPIVDQGVPIAVINTRDITDRRHAEEALASANAFGRTVADAIMAGLVIHNSAGLVQFVNRAFLDMTGWSADELIGTAAPFAYWPDDDAARRASLFNRALGEGVLPPGGFEGNLRRRDGSCIPALTMPSVMMVGGDRQLLTVFYDLTDRKRLESEMRQAQKLEAVGRLAGGVAHDFNNLLTAILGYSEFALESLGEFHPLRNDIEQIRRAGESAASLTRQLLAFSRRQQLQTTAIDLNQVVSDLRRMLQRVIGEDISVKLALAPGLPPIKADRGQLDQVLMNLAVNARDAMPEGGTLFIQTGELVNRAANAEHGVPPGNWVVLGVSDTGSGMSAETRNHLFEPFFTTKEAGKGTGLGLATVYGIVKQSGGMIRVDSAPGKGTTFAMFFPCSYESAADLEGEDTGIACGNAERILLVEDDEPLRMLCMRALENSGYTVRAAHDAEEAIRIVEADKDRFHLLLTDVVMPGQNGAALADQLADRDPDLRVLLMSGYLNEHVRVSEGAPQRPLLRKPFAPMSLIRKVQEVLGHADAVA